MFAHEQDVHERYPINLLLENRHWAIETTTKLLSLGDIFNPQNKECQLSSAVYQWLELLLRQYLKPANFRHKSVENDPTSFDPTKFELSLNPIMIQIDKDGTNCSQKLGAKITVDKTAMSGLEEFLVCQLSDLFNGHARISVWDDSGKFSEIIEMTSGSLGNERATLGNGKPTPIHLTITNSTETIHINKNISAAVLAQLIATFPPSERATPGKRKDCAIALLQSAFKISIESTGGKIVELKLEDWTYDLENPLMRSECKIVAQSVSELERIGKALTACPLFTKV